LGWYFSGKLVAVWSGGDKLMKDMDNSSLVVRDVSSDSAARIIVSVAWRRRHL
jgi:hypothetical protein